MKSKSDKPKDHFGPTEELYPWEEQMGFPVGGVNQPQLVPLLEQAYRHAVVGHAWTVMENHWKGNQPALEELARLRPDACEAMARFTAKHFLRTVPQTGISEERFWDDFCIFNLRASHNYDQDGWFKAYIRFRADRPDLLPFLRGVMQAAEAKETPELGDRMLFCIFWDFFILPVRFWADDAAAELLTVSACSFNLDKVRNTRRELGLKRVRPTIVKRFKSLPSPSPGEPQRIEIQLDDKAAKRAGVSAMFNALVAFLKSPKFPKS